ncbi:Peptidyl-Lys metalloendopeptidase [Ceratobasidium theobromae]|uniref:Peptidyl-Lys metalloendopeptidase n=1 Tax=Ceratobasidium theobromae TaxID=1582974 RepID=A0A5N5Q9G6_9AGAM|nr:Peptidyl-Lys metalloendopeptidase [Ceratobasidium theobromae]
MRTAFAASLACAAVLGVSAAPSIHVSTGVPAQVNGVDNLSITTVVTNTGDEALKILNNPGSALVSAETKTFEIANDKGSPAFTGMLVKYSPQYVVKNNDPADFTVLQPGESREVTHSLAGVYDFATAGPGEYKVSPLNTFQYVDGSGNLATIEATTEPATFEIGGNLVSSKVLHRRQPRLVGRQNSPQFLNCGDPQKAQVSSAVRAAEGYAQQATAYMSQVNRNTDRYSTWFGPYDANRAATVRSHFQRIMGQATRSTYDCAPPSCPNQSTFAYVYASQPGRVYLCGAFWRAPLTGTDSMAGTIVHEQTHFDINGGTRDHQYGQQGCKALASQRPDLAVMNADSHEYFAENNPAQQ